MSWTSGGLDSPSMASLLGSPAHATSKIPTGTQEQVGNRKRKNASQDQTKAPAQKRLKPKPMGRPRNGWTPTRKRKLVRLYLMTDLNVGEIAEVLRGKHFEPWYGTLLDPEVLAHILAVNGISKRNVGALYIQPRI